jgi:N-formylglutamate deformylase
MADLWSLVPSDAPLIVNVPHAGIFLPAEIASRLTPAALAVPDTDWHVHRLYEFVTGMNVTLMSATHSRIVVDLNRDPSGDALYPGASNTEICPTTTFHDEDIYQAGAAPDAGEISMRIERYWRPYQVRLAQEIERIRRIHGYCILLDGHSIVSQAPRFFDGRLPDFNLGTASGTSCDAGLASRAFAVLSEAASFSAVHNGRFKGGYITRQYGRPEQNMHALQLEMAQCAYMDEALPVQFNADRAEALMAVLRQLVGSLLSWRPVLAGHI